MPGSYKLEIEVNFSVDLLWNQLKYVGSNGLANLAMS